MKEEVIVLYRKLLRLWVLKRLYSSRVPILFSLANVIIETLENKISSEEKTCINKIEHLRKELEASSKEMTIMDYGKRSPDSDLTPQQMYQGKVITKTIGDVCRTNSKSIFWSLLLFKLIREYRPSVCLELGTSLGISAAYQAAALELNKNGELVTLEGSESLASLAIENFNKLSLKRVFVRLGRFQDILDDVLAELGNVDYAFIDGHHDGDATLEYFEKIIPFLSEFALIVFDDISWSKGMKEAWRKIFKYKSVKVSVDFGNLGIIVLSNSIEKKRRYNFYLI